MQREEVDGHFRIHQDMNTSLFPSLSLSPRHNNKKHFWGVELLGVYCTYERLMFIFSSKNGPLKSSSNGVQTIAEPDCSSVCPPSSPHPTLVESITNHHDQSIPYSSQPPLTPISLSIPYLTCQGIMGEPQRGPPATMDTKAVLRRSVSWWEKCDSRLPTRPGLPETFPLVALKVLCPGKPPSVLCKQLVTLHHNLCPLEQALPHVQEIYIFN